MVAILTATVEDPSLEDASNISIPIVSLKVSVGGGLCRRSSFLLDEGLDICFSHNTLDSLRAVLLIAFHWEHRRHWPVQYCTRTDSCWGEPLGGKMPEGSFD